MQKIHILKVWVSKINGNLNQNHSYDTTELSENDTIAENFNVYKVGKPVLVEYFTQASCVYCGMYDPNLQNTVSEDADFTMAIAYHYWFEGTDPMWNSANSSDCMDRVNFYGVTGTPASFANGVTSPDLLYYGSECDLATNTEKDTVFEIETPVVTLSGNTITYSANIVANKNITGNIKGYVAVIEQNIDFTSAPGTNGQKVFPWVMRKMCPTGSGTSLPTSMNAGDKQTLSGSWTYSNSSATEIYNPFQIRVIFFVQNTTTKEIYWAAMLQPTSGINENHNLSIEAIYPNPARDEVKINFNLIKPEEVSINLCDMLGKTIFSKDLGIVSTGQTNYTMDLNSINTGMYFIAIKSGNEQSVKKINVIK